TMRQALLYVLVGVALSTASPAADRKSWNKVRYLGGTAPIKTTPYDWNTTVTATLNPDSIEVVIAPAKLFAPPPTIRLKPAQIVSLSRGRAAWQHVSEVTGAHIPPKPPSLFGLLGGNSPLGIVYRADDGKLGALLLESYFGSSILLVLQEMSG